MHCGTGGENVMQLSIWVLVILGYLIGSVPFALVIGKGFYNTDVREYGSKNLGASNSGRVLGMAAGAAVMFLDAAKAFVVIFLAARYCENPAAVPLGGLAAAVGHCYPVFAKFKGGKAVAALYGFLFGLFVFADCSPLIFFLPLTIFIAVLFVTKIIALASMISATAAAIYAVFATDSLGISVVLAVLALLIIFRHRGNIKRILNGEENKISWM